MAGMITTRGFRDIVHIGRHQRPLHYSVMQDIPWQARPFVQRRHRKVVTERIVPPTGEVLTPLDEQEVRAAARELLAEGVEAVAVCFLFSYLNPEHERRAAAIVREEMPDAFVTTSADIVPQFREFERFTTATMSAFVGPRTGNYLDRLATGARARGRRGRPARDDVERRRRERARRRRAPRDAVALRPGGRHPRRPVGGRAGRSQPADHVRHGRNVGRHRDRHRGRHRGGVGARHVDRRLSAARADARRAHDRGRWRLDRVRRRGRRVPRRAPLGRRHSGPRVLRQRRARGDHLRRAHRARPSRSRAVPRRSHASRSRGRGRRGADAGRPARARARGDGGGHPHDRELQHGARDPLAHDREGPRSARLLARRVRRCRPAARRRAGRLARDPRGAGAGLPGHHVGGRAAHERPQVRPDAHGLPDAGIDRRRAPEPRARRARRRAARLAAARRRGRRARSR